MILLCMIEILSIIIKTNGIQSPINSIETSIGKCSSDVSTLLLLHLYDLGKTEARNKIKMEKIF